MVTASSEDASGWDSMMRIISFSRYPDIEEYNGMPDDSFPGGDCEGRLLIMFSH
jgi:hypothetical protein